MIYTSLRRFAWPSTALLIAIVIFLLFFTHPAAVPKLFHPLIHGTPKSTFPEYAPPILPPEDTQETHPPTVHNDPHEYFVFNSISRFHRTPGPTDAGGFLSNLVTSQPANDPCISFPKYHLKNVQIILKTGIAEQTDRVKASFTSVAACLDNLLIYSDLDYDIEGRHAQDVLAEVPESYKDGNIEWEVYEEQKAAFKAGEYRNGGGSEYHRNAWVLDVYKWPRILERAWEENPSAKWYIITEADTYFFWDNVFRMLDSYDHDTPLYFGSPSPGRDETWFAYGGAGVIISSGAMKRIMHREVGASGEYTTPPLSHRYAENVRGDCCGDSVLGWILHEHGIDISGLWPHMNPHPYSGVPFGEARWWSWCQPVLSMHKTTPENEVELWKWETEWKLNNTGPLLYRDLLDFQELHERRDDWENADWGGYPAPGGTDDTPSPAGASFEACSAACDKERPCLSFTHHDGHCTLLNQIRVGHGRGPDEGGKFTAGWRLEKIAQFKRDNTCPDAQWMKPSIERIF